MTPTQWFCVIVLLFLLGTTPFAQAFWRKPKPFDEDN